MSQMIAKLADGTSVDITDRDYYTRPDGETVLRAVIATDGRTIPARRVQSIELRKETRPTATKWWRNGPDDYAAGYLPTGETWSVTRYGTLVTNTIGDEPDTVQFADEVDARREYLCQVDDFRDECGEHLTARPT